LSGSSEPLATGVHVPTVPGSAQEAQSWLQAVLQQTPWEQNPLWHSLLAVQAVGLPPPQRPERHATPLEQSSSPAQIVLQRPSATSQANGAQLKPRGPQG
jgi:hypothetical protein